MEDPFGEKLAVVEQGTSDPDGMGLVYEKVSSLLANNLADAEDVLGLERVERKRSTLREGYRYDVFVSYAHAPLLEDMLRPVLELVQTWGTELRGEELRLFVDYTELGPGARWSEKLQDALARSKLLLAVLTPRYFQSEWARREWNAFRSRERRAEVDPWTLIVPILLHGSPSELPQEARARQYADFTDLTRHGSDKPSLRLNRRTQDLASEIVKRLEQVPPFDPKLTALPPVLGPPAHVARTSTKPIT